MIIKNVKHEYRNFKDNLIKYKCLCCNKTFQQKFNKKGKKAFFNKYKCFNRDINKFILFLRNVVCAYEYNDDWEEFNETLSPKNEDFYSNLNVEDIIDADYAHRKRVCRDFKMKNLGEYHNLYFQFNTLFLADLFENFRKMCPKIYKPDPAHFLIAPD